MTARPPARILVTRAEPGASATAWRLLAVGYEPIVEPLFTLQPIAANLPSFDALAFTSANGVRAFAALSPAREAPVFVVGQRTAEAAREAGFANVASADGDAAALTVLIAAQLAPGAQLLHAGNEDSRGDLAGALQARGLNVSFRALYRAEPCSQPGPLLAAHLKGEAVLDAMMVHSPRAGEILAGFLALALRPAPTFVAAISPAAAAALHPLAGRLEIAASPDEAALLAALKTLLARD